MYRAPTDVEWANAVHVCRRVEFDLSILDKFGPETTPDNFPDLNIPNTPELNNFDDVDYAGRDDKWGEALARVHWRWAHRRCG